jgi:hypothetical protein
LGKMRPARWWPNFILLGPLRQRTYKLYFNPTVPITWPSVIV